MLNGSNSSNLPVARSSRSRVDGPASFTQSLPSTCAWLVTMLSCESSLSRSGGSCQIWNFSVLGSNLATPPWYIMPSKRLPSRSMPRSRLPVGKPLRSSGMAYSVCLPVLGSILPRNCSPKFEYQASPFTMMTSCGSMVARGRSYSVMMTLVPRPFTRGSVLSSNSCFMPGAQIDGGEILGHLAEAFRIGGARLVHPPLRLDRLADLGIAVHARDHLHELVGVVARFHHPLEGVAAHAVDELELVVVGAGDAHHPFGIGELLAQVAGLAQLEVGAGGLPRRDIGVFGTFEVISDRANLQAVAAGREPRRREAVAALRVGDDADGDVRTILLGADDHAFHRSFLGRGDLAGESAAAPSAPCAAAGGLEFASKRVNADAAPTTKAMRRNSIAASLNPTLAWGRAAASPLRPERSCCQRTGWQPVGAIPIQWSHDEAATRRNSLGRRSARVGYHVGSADQSLELAHTVVTSRCRAPPAGGVSPRRPDRGCARASRCRRNSRRVGTRSWRHGHRRRCGRRPGSRRQAWP